MILHLRAAVAQLYAVQPGRFTALRSELVAAARTAGDKELAASVAALRKPTVAAWAVNHLVRSRPEALADLIDFAELLREAQRSLDADQLRVLGRERSRRVDELVEVVTAAASEAGTPVGAGAAAEVRETLIAVIADEQAQATVVTGCLVKALSYSGFGSVDIADVVAVGQADDEEGERSAPSLSLLRGGRHGDDGAAAGTGAESGPSADLLARRRARRAAARERLADRVEQAGAALRTAERQAAVLAARRQEVVDGIADLERRLATARGRLAKVSGELAEADGIREDREDDEAEALAALASHDARAEQDTGADG
ncbi:MAG: hypothetical protein ABIS35_01990 [Terracoccus sp.]